MKTVALTLTAAALLLLSRTSAAANVEAGDGDVVGAWGLDVITDRVDTAINTLTEQTAMNDTETQAANVAAFLSVIRKAEGTDQAGDPYRVCYGYKHTITDLSDHPALTGEWRGERLPDAMCKNAGFGPGCVSTAAGAYQIIKPTWVNLRRSLGLFNFGQYSQDGAAIELIRRRGALEDVKAGRIAQAIDKCRNEWASLPGNYARQGQRSMGQLVAWYEQSGGITA